MILLGAICFMHNPFIVLSILRPILKTSQTGCVVIRHPMVTEIFFSSCCFALLFALFAMFQNARIMPIWLRRIPTVRHA